MDEKQFETIVGDLIASAKHVAKAFRGETEQANSRLFEAKAKVLSEFDTLRSRVEELEKELDRVRRQAEHTLTEYYESQKDDFENMNAEIARLREQVRYRGIGEEQPGEGEEIITIDDNLSANLICYFSEEKEHWINQGVRWIPVPLPQPPEDE